MEAQEEIIDIISQSGPMGFKRPLKMLYYLIMRKALGKHTLVKNLVEDLKMSHKSIYKSLDFLEDRNFIAKEYSIKGVNKIVINITSQGEKFVHEIVLPVFYNQQALSKDIIQDKLTIDESTKITLIHDFLSFVTPDIMRFFKKWIIDQIGTVIPSTCFHDFEEQYRNFFIKQVSSYLKKDDN